MENKKPYLDQLELMKLSITDLITLQNEGETYFINTFPESIWRNDRYFMIEIQREIKSAILKKIMPLTTL